MNSRGRRDRPSGGKGRSGAARGPEKKFAKRGFAAKGDGDKRPYAARPEGAKSSKGTTVLVMNGRSRARTSARAMIVAVTSAPTSRPASARNTAATIAGRAANEATRDPLRNSQEKKHDDKRSYSPRGEGFRKDGERPRGDRAYSPGLHATAMLRNASENSAATKSFRAAAIATNVGRARNMAAVRIGIRIGGRPEPGRSATQVRPIIAVAIRVRRATTPKTLKSAAMTSRAMTSRGTHAAVRNVHVFRARARIGRIIQLESARIESGRSSSARGKIAASGEMTGRSIRAANRVRSNETPTGRAGTTRTRVRFSPSVRLSEVAAPIASDRPRNAARHGRPAKKIRRAHRQGCVACRTCLPA